MPAIRILLDQNAPIGLRRALADHEVVPAGRMCWAAVTNGDLIRAAELLLSAGCTCVVVMVLTHVAERLDVLPIMGWVCRTVPGITSIS